MGKFFGVHVRMGVYDLGGNGPRTGPFEAILAGRGGAFLGSFLGSFSGSFLDSFLESLDSMSSSLSFGTK